MQRTVIVTGGASGIGRAICEAFARISHCSVYCLDIDRKVMNSLSWDVFGIASGVFMYDVDVSNADVKSVRLVAARRIFL